MLKKHYSINSRCYKCVSDDVSTKYGSDKTTWKDPNEDMCRRYRICGHVWHEYPLDYKTHKGDE